MLYKMLYNMKGCVSTAGRMKRISPAVISLPEQTTAVLLNHKKKGKEGKKKCLSLDCYTLSIIAVTLAYVVWNYMRIRKCRRGTAEMVEMAAIIRSGANTFYENRI